MKNIEHLLKKYDRNYVPGEKRSTAYDNMIRQKNILNENIHKLHLINQELNPEFQLNRCDIRIAETLAVQFQSQLNTLCRNCKTEAILLVFLLFIKKVENPKIELQEEPLYNKYELTQNKYNLIISRALKYSMEQSPIPITTTTDYDHDLLIRNGGR